MHVVKISMVIIRFYSCNQRENYAWQNKMSAICLVTTTDDDEFLLIRKLFKFIKMATNFKVN